MQQERLAQEIQRLLPSCRKGEGYADELETSGDEISGRAVPYGRTIELFPGVLEDFAPGTFARQVKQAHRVKLCLEHGQVVGRVTELEDRDNGLYFRAKVSDNPGIPEAARFRALVAERLVDELSIGFQTVAGGTEARQLDDGNTHYRHTRARLLEISLVPWGAYGRDATLSRARIISPEAQDRALALELQRAWVAKYRARSTF